RPWSRQCIINNGDLVMEQVAIGLVEKDTLLEDSLVVFMKGNAADINGARPLKAACFDFEGIVAAIPILVDPFSVRKAEERGLNRLRPFAFISENAPDVDVNVVGYEVRDVRQDHDFHGIKN